MDVQSLLKLSLVSFILKDGEIDSPFEGGEDVSPKECEMIPLRYLK